MSQSRDAQPESPFKMGDTSPILNAQTSQYTDFIGSHKEKMSDMSPILHLTEQNAVLQRDLLEAVRQNGDLRVEVERLRMDVERRDARITELERQLAETPSISVADKTAMVNLEQENRRLRIKIQELERIGLTLTPETDSLQKDLPPLRNRSR